jgi:hypothetical protein
MTTQTVDDVLHDLAKRGEISHISLTPSQNGKLWRASFAMCSKFGVTFAEDADPAQAIIRACTSAKMKPRSAQKRSAIVEHEPELPTREGLLAAADAVEVEAGIRNPVVSDLAEFEDLM